MYIMYSGSVVFVVLIPKNPIWKQMPNSFYEALGRTASKAKDAEQQKAFSLESLLTHK